MHIKETHSKCLVILKHINVGELQTSLVQEFGNGIGRPTWEEKTPLQSKHGDFA